MLSGSAGDPTFSPRIFLRNFAVLGKDLRCRQRLSFPGGVVARIDVYLNKELQKMTMTNYKRWCQPIRRGVLGLLAMIALAWGCSESAQAQSAYHFHYHNPRTGFSYSQGAVQGQGYYAGGFSYSNRNRSFSTYNSYSLPRSRYAPRYVYSPRYRYRR